MKKILLSAVAVLMWFNASALNPTAKMAINLVSEKNATDNVSLVEDPSFSPAKEEFESNKIIMTESASNVNVYALQEAWEDPKASIVMTNNLEGTKIVVITNETETSYKFTFSNVAGRTLKLWDKLLNVYTDITPTAVYPFTIATAGRQTIADRFEIVAEEVRNFKICTTFDKVEIYDNEGTDNIVITNMAGDTVVNVAPVAIFQSIDLSGKPAGHYVLTVNGTQYEFCNKPVGNN